MVFILKIKIVYFSLFALPLINSDHVFAKRFHGKKESRNATFQSVHARHLSQKKRAFIDFLHPHIVHANVKIKKEREQLLRLYRSHVDHETLSDSERNWIVRLQRSYAMQDFQFDSNRDWIELLNRVDIVPAPLAIAQAATESAWGASRFAVEGNNFFGQWCFTFSCGMVPKKRSPGATYEIKRFTSAYDSVLSYIRNLNSHQAYQLVRSIRADLRNRGKDLTGDVLALGLGKYSSRGQAYIREVQYLIKHNQLEKYQSLPYPA
jgi:Bax protein